MSRTLPIGIVACALVAGCASSGSAPRGVERDVVRVDLPSGLPVTVEIYRDDGVTTGRIAASADEVWPHVARSYADLGLGADAVTLYDPESRRLAVADHRTRRLGDRKLSLFLNCGHSLTSPRIDNGMGRITLETWLADEDGSTRVSIRLSGQARNTGTSGSAIRCSSNGRLETQLIDRLVHRVVQGTGEGTG